VVHEYARLVADADERFRLCVRLMLYDVAIEVRENFRRANIWKCVSTFNVCAEMIIFSFANQ
jgi:hypothetical protein